eukprot:Hpha_TRINITY_DN3273_c0_g1::TRINITY_DN3273_c0_g1_i1::g.185827::m.185827
MYLRHPFQRQISRGHHKRRLAHQLCFWKGVQSGVGTNCYACVAGADPATGCGECLEGYTGKPNNCERCTGVSICNGKAQNVIDDGTRKYCVCDCDVGFDRVWDCGRCSDGYLNYPSCTPT